METGHFLCFFLVEKTIHFFFWFFLDTLSPYFLFSLERLTVSGIRKPLGEEEFSGTLPRPLDLQLRHAWLAAGGLA